MLEAIDASYAIGFVQAIFETTANPSNGARSFKVVLGKFIAKVDIPEPFGATVAYNIPTQSPLKVYG